MFYTAQSLLFSKVYALYSINLWFLFFCAIIFPIGRRNHRMIKSHDKISWIKKAWNLLRKINWLSRYRTREGNYWYPSLRKIQSFKINDQTFERNRYLPKSDHRHEFRILWFQRYDFWWCLPLCEKTGSSWQTDVSLFRWTPENRWLGKCD